MVNHETFAKLMGVFPTGVTIVTSVHVDGTPRGATVNAFSSISQAPPICMVAISKQSLTVPAVLSAAAFAINFLSIDQELLSRRFASKVTDKFDGVSWTATTAGLPVITGVAAVVECDLRRCIDVGDHWMILGTVIGGQVNDHTVPLAYYRRQYGSFTPWG